jgi:predicted RNase H-like HicB family nuclease
MNMKNKTVELVINLPMKIKKKQKGHVASCPILDVHSQGSSKEEAKKNLVEALTAFFISCLKRSTLDSVLAILKECGFEPRRQPPKNKKIVFQEDYINIPIPFLVKSRNPEHNHA